MRLEVDRSAAQRSFDVDFNFVVSIDGRTWRCVRPNVKLTGILRRAGFGLGFYSPNAARRKMSG